MRVEARLFEILTDSSRRGRLRRADRRVSPTVAGCGTTALVLTAGLSPIIGTFFRFVARRPTPPEDYPDADIADGAGELGFFAAQLVAPSSCAGSPRPPSARPCGCPG